MPIQFKCAHCGQRLSIGTRMAGRQVHCTQCQKRVLVPSLPAASEPAPDSSNSSNSRTAPPTSSTSASQVAPPASSLDDELWGEQAAPLRPPPVPDWFLTPPPPPPEPTTREATTSAAAPDPITPNASAESPPSHADSPAPNGLGPPAESAPRPPTPSSTADEKGGSRKLDTVSSNSANAAAAPPRRSSLNAVADRLADLSSPRSSSSTGSPSGPGPVVLIADKREEAEWVYEDDEDDDEGPPANPRYVAISRTSLYAAMAASLILAVAAFGLGMLFGGGWTSAEVANLEASPCDVTGEVLYARGAEAPAADEGAVVVLLPRDERPSRDQRIPGERLGPLQVPPPANDEAIRAIRKMGGDYARVDRQGRYRLRSPDRGRYYLLVISANRKLKSPEEASRSDLSEIGGFFHESLLLLGDQQYSWRVLRVDDHRKVRHRVLRRRPLGQPLGAKCQAQEAARWISPGGNDLKRSVVERAWRDWWSERPALATRFFVHRSSRPRPENRGLTWSACDAPARIPDGPAIPPRRRDR